MYWLINTYQSKRENHLWGTTFACSRGTGTRARHVPAVTHQRRFRDCRDSSKWLSWLLVTAVTRPAVTHQHPSRATRARVPSRAPILQPKHWYPACSRRVSSASGSWLQLLIQAPVVTVRRDCRYSSRRDSSASDSGPGSESESYMSVLAVHEYRWV